ncbi:MAG: hypothetical protein J6M02_06640 [Clostridia bacterium]|nr:hypothetical protein [Clostridia bacterium]
MEKRQSEYDEIRLNLLKKSLESNGEEIRIPKERRKGEDGILKFINFVSFTVWGVIFILFAIITKAGVSVAYIREHQLLWVSSDFWFKDYLRIALNLTIVCLVICTFSIILNFTRNRRRNDRIKKSIIVYEIMAFIIGIFLILKLY